MVLEIVVGTSQTIARIIFVEKLVNQTFCMLHEIVARVFHEVRELKVPCHNLIIDLLHIVGIDFDEGIFRS